MNPRSLRWFGLLVGALPLAAQTVTDFFVFKGTVYEQTADTTPTILADPSPHAPGPYYLDVGVTATGLSSAPSFKRPFPNDVVSTSLIPNTDSTRWDFKAGYSDRASLDSAYDNGAYKITIPGFNSGSEMTLTLSGNQYPSVIPGLAGLGTGLSWDNVTGKLMVDLNTATTLNFQPFTDYNTSHSGGLEFRQRLAIVPPTGSDFGKLAVSAFNNAAFTDYQLSLHPLVAGTEYRVVLEYDVFTTRLDVGGTEGGAIYSNQTQFFMVAIPEPSTYAFLAGLTMLVGAAWRRRRRV